MNIKEPSGEQCTNHEKVFDNEDKVGYAVWYPQMGGYVGKAVAMFDKKWKSFPNGSQIGGCIDVLIWHDGEFPFGGNNPREIHHCSPEQFIEFGKFLTNINNQNESKEK